MFDAFQLFIVDSYKKGYINRTHVLVFLLNLKYLLWMTNPEIYQYVNDVFVNLIQHNVGIQNPGPICKTSQTHKNLFPTSVQKCTHPIP